MRAQERLEVLMEQGAIQEIIRPLMSGKEAEVYLVLSDDEIRVAKIYKTANNRSFKHRAEYTEGRKVRNSRSQRAMGSRSRFGKEQEEAAWRNAEVDVIYRLAAAGVRVPEPYVFIDGVLVMELIQDFDGEPAPRLCDVELAPDEAMAVFKTLLKDVVRMLCAGVVHGDLSDFNVLMSPEGPVIIDFPQAVDPAHNRNAQKLLIRDVKNLTSFLSRWAPSLKKTRYAEEMWALYEKNDLDPETELTGKFKGSSRKANTQSVLDEIAASARAEYQRRVALGLELPKDMEEQEEEVERVLARRAVKRGKPGSAKPGSQAASKSRTAGSGQRQESRGGARKSDRGGRNSTEGGRNSNGADRNRDAAPRNDSNNSRKRDNGRRDERPDLRAKGGSDRNERRDGRSDERRDGRRDGRRDERPDLRKKSSSDRGGRRDERPDLRKTESRRDDRRDGRRDERPDLRKSSDASPGGESSGRRRSSRNSGTGRGGESRGGESRSTQSRSGEGRSQQKRRKPRKGPNAPVVVERRPARSGGSASSSTRTSASSGSSAAGGTAPRRRKPRNKD